MDAWYQYIININNGITKPTYGYQNYNTSETLIYDANLEVRILVCTRVDIWVITILNQIDTQTFLPRYENSCMVYTLELCVCINIVKYIKVKSWNCTHQYNHEIDPNQIIEQHSLLTKRRLKYSPCIYWIQMLHHMQYCGYYVHN